MKKRVCLFLALMLALLTVWTVASAAVKVGDYVKFGYYGDEKIEWLVLDREGDKLFLLSRYGLDKIPFHGNSDGTMWKECDLRAWLNDSFYVSAFNKNERKFILDTEVADDKDENWSKWVTKGRVSSKKTTDKVFCLSYREVREYLAGDDDNMKCIPSSYAISQGGNVSNKKYLNGQKTCWWWLRSSAFRNNAGVVDWDGSIETCYIHHPYGVVRPCMWIEAGAVE